MTITKPSLRRKELVSVAARLFKENSFDRTTVRLLASATGLKSGSLFHHFKDKEEILFAVIEDGLQRSLETIQQELKNNTGIEERLFAIIYGHLRTLHGQEKNAHTVSITEWKSLSEESKKKLIKIRDDYEAYWQQVIDEAVDAGILKGNPQLLRLFILGSLNWTVQWFQAEKKLSIKQLADESYLSFTHQAVPAK
ncbi:MAG: TetR/AcrR family transcriptional regulator [Gammaproteobacteria bacterium]|nr:MAG: TetR/AcrR family transcriptional regulator [Gammaproteobacteria bacterium]RLA24375.1 MAG: TetR/AcrR family transcriptional regulator [Gammaproteobacteria bacterium]